MSGKRLSEAVRNEAVRLWKTGASLHAISEQLGSSRHSLRRWIEKAGHEIIPRFDRKHTLNEDYFASVDTAEKAYFIGFLLGDGCAYAKAKAIIINVASVDIDILHKFRKAIGSNGPIWVRNRVSPFDKTVKPLARFQANSRRLFADAGSYGIVPRKSLREVPPKLSEALEPHFWRGVVDSDGWVSPNRLTLGIVGSRSVAEAFHAFIKRLSPDFHGSVRRSGSNFTVVIHGTEALLVAKTLYSGASVYLDRKFALYQKMLTVRRAASCSWTCTCGKRGMAAHPKVATIRAKYHTNTHTLADRETEQIIMAAVEVES